jgi:hypothetical protein
MSAERQATVNHYKAAFQNLKSSGLTLVFQSGLAATEVAMGVSAVVGADGIRRYRVHPGNRVIVFVNPAVFNSRSFTSEQIKLAMFHELLHFSPAFQVQIEQQFQSGRRGCSWEEWHQRPYDDEACRMIGIVSQTPPATPPPDRSVIRGGPGGQTLESFNPEGNVVMGGEGDDHIRVEGNLNSVDGGGGNDTFYLSERTGILLIASAGPGEHSTLVIDPPWTLQHLRVEYFNTALYVGIDPENSNRTGAELENLAEIYGYSAGTPSVSSVRIDGQTLSIETIRAMANTAPSFQSGNHLTLQAPFPGGAIGPRVRIVDDDPGDALTLSIRSVTGWGANKSWTLADVQTGLGGDGYWAVGSAQLTTNTTWTLNSFAETEVTLRASDGKTWTDEVITVRWRPDPDSGVIEP